MMLWEGTIKNTDIRVLSPKDLLHMVEYNMAQNANAKLKRRIDTIKTQNNHMSQSFEQEKINASTVVNNYYGTNSNNTFSDRSSYIFNNHDEILHNKGKRRRRTNHIDYHNTLPSQTSYNTLPSQKSDHVDYDSTHEYID